jgi:hypothetical protein
MWPMQQLTLHMSFTLPKLFALKKHAGAQTAKHLGKNGKQSPQVG